MSGEILRKAAAKIRADQDVEEQLGHIDAREYATWLAVADWLDWVTEPIDDRILPHDAPLYVRAIAVATAYLGSADD